MVRCQELCTETRCKGQSAAIGERNAVMSAFESARRHPKIPIKVVTLCNSDCRQIGESTRSLAFTCASKEVVENFAQIDRVCETLAAGSSERIRDDLGAGFVAQIRNHR